MIEPALLVQALFIATHGKELFLKVCDKLHEKYDFEKTQQLLGADLEKGKEMLERALLEVKKE